MLFKTVHFLLLVAVNGERPANARFLHSTARSPRQTNTLDVTEPRLVTNRGRLDFSDTSLRLVDGMKWRLLFLSCREVVNHMYPPPAGKPTKSVVADTVVLIHTREVPGALRGFDTSFQFTARTSRIVVHELPGNASREEVMAVLNVTLKMENDVGSVVVLSSHVGFISLVIESLAMDPVFPWRRLKHATEWIVMAVDLETVRFGPIQKSLPDFMTVLRIHSSHEDVNFTMTQKSRLNPLHTVFTKVLLQSNGQNLEQMVRDSINVIGRVVPVRVNAVMFLQKQKSQMAGMKLPIAVVDAPNDGAVYRVPGEDRSRWDGYAMDALRLLSERLGFDYDIRSVEDGGSYGLFNSDGEAKGVVGVLSKREAGMSIMAMTHTERRLEHLDFLNTLITTEPLYIVYRAGTSISQVGDVHQHLFHSRSVWLLNLVLPATLCLAAGVFIYLVSGVLLNRTALCSRWNLRRLYNFPLLWVYQTGRVYPHQSGRILRACYGLFCVVYFAAYRAAVTSDATAPREFPVISDLEGILEHPGYDIGISKENSATFTALENAHPGTTQAQIWQTIVRSNRTDPRVLSADNDYHLNRVMNSNYAYIGTGYNMIPTNQTSTKYSEVRFSRIGLNQLFMTVPKDVFYKADLEKALHQCVELGIIEEMKARVVHDYGDVSPNRAQSTTIHLNRMKLLFHLMCGGLASAGVCLIVERLLYSIRVVRENFNAAG